MAEHKPNPFAFLAVFGLPALLLALFFGCNDKTGCPFPAALSPSTLTLEKLKAETPWPADGVWGLCSWEAMGWTLAYYFLSLVLYRVLPAQELLGTKLVESGRPLKYRFNSFSSTVVQFAALAVGTYLKGADFAVWVFISDHYLEILTANLILAYIISVYVYIASFGVKRGNPELRELAVAGHTGNMMFDFWIGRELNPRVTLPLFGEVDIKSWLEMRPGLTGWIVLDLAFCAKQYRTYGYLSDSILFTTAFQAYYVLESQLREADLLMMMDVTTDGLGFMLTFGNIAWVPFLYSTQARYLSVYPVQLGWAGCAGVTAVFAIGFYIFRSANSQKKLFRRQPDHPSVKDMPFIQTKRGTRLLTGGWWGKSRHINYLGDWIQGWPFCLPTGIAGYQILSAGSVGSAAPGVFTMLDGREVVQGAARGWGIPFTYFYLLYFGVLLIHREMRDDAACAEKYGEDWEKYKRLVRWRILPGVY
ncbi:C-14 sterol reductase [Colletotrichum eremochloae]|nr:C-14 sterol reductase [Colletotrichum eremochloae]